jgi:hypothetical protein
MQKNSLHVNLLKSQELLVAKRLVELVSSEKEKMKVVEKANSELAIEDFLGKKPEEAEQDIDKKIKISKEQMDQMLKNWGGLWGQWAPSNLKFDSSNLKNMENDLQKLAEERVKLKATQLKLDEEKIEKHAKGSIMILKEKRDILKDFMGDVNASIREKEKQLQSVQKANEALGFFKKAYWGIRNSDLEKEIKNLKQMKERAEKLQGRVEDKNINKKESLNKVGELDAKLRSIILSHDERVAGDLDRVIRGEIVDSQDAYPGGLEAFFNAHPDLGLSDLEKDTCRKILDYLKKGSRRANWTGSRLGTFSQSDVEAYYLDKYMDRGALNKENDKVKDRVERLKSLPLGQHILLNNQEFAVIRKPSAKYNGYIVKKGPQIGFIDIKNMEKPVLTLQEGDGSYVSWNLSAKKNESPSLTAVEFSAEEIKLQSPTAAPQAAPEPASTPEPAANPTPTPPTP